jgi:hypothetical protein
MGEHEKSKSDLRMAKPMSIVNDNRVGIAYDITYGPNSWTLPAGSSRTGIDVSIHSIVVGVSEPPTSALPVTITNTANDTTYLVEATQGNSRTALNVGQAYQFDLGLGSVTLVDTEPARRHEEERR